jgi:predicted  nucleic acid-binding Zn-ribbon protein
MNQAEYERRRYELSCQIRRCESQLSSTNSNISACQGETRVLNDELRDGTTRLANTTEELRQAERSIEQHHEGLARLKQRAAVFTKAVSVRRGRSTAVGTLGSSVSFARAYHDRMHTMLTGSEFTKATQSIEAAEQGINRRLNELQAQRESLKSQKRGLEAKIAEARSRIASLDSRVLSLGHERAALKQSINQLAVQMRQLEYQRALGMSA